MVRDMGWLLLMIAGLFEIGYAVCLKLADGFTNPTYTVAFLVFAAISFGLLNMAARTIPLSTAYAIWTGIGSTGTAIAGIALFAEPAGAMRLLFLGLIIASIIGLKLFSPAEATANR
jgi:quaternary ammonium compound-resistance protein SugE